jgi:APA family basic amino acid/polyamine antiporter
MSGGRLLRVLGVGFGLAVIIGNTIGAGIFRTAGIVAEQLPHPAWFLGVWLVGGTFALIAAFSVAELGTMIPRSGGHYVFAHHALGEYPGFVIGWSDWLSNAGSSAAVSIVIGEYIGILIPPLAPFKVVTAILVVVFFAALQWRGIKTGSGVQNVSSLLKALAFLALVIACFWYQGKAPGTHAPPPMPTGTQWFLAFTLALQAVIYTCDGWAGIIYFSEETKNPARDVPRSMFMGTLAVIAIYMLVCLATVKVVPMSEIAGNVFAIGVAAKTVFGGYGDSVVQIVLIVAMLSAINAYQLMTCRIIYSMSLDGLFPRRASHVNQGGTPDFALLLSTLVAVLFIATGTLEQVVAIMAFFFTCNYVVDLISVIVMRKREPDRPRPYRAWGYPWTTGFALLAYSAFLLSAIRADWTTSRWSLLLLAVSYPIFKLVKRLL